LGQIPASKDFLKDMAVALTLIFGTMAHQRHRGVGRQFV
jgi:hypothetical protein